MIEERNRLTRRIFLRGSIGAAAGGVVGALVGEGVPEQTAQWYQEAIKAGSVLVTVHADDRARDARETLQRWGGVEDQAK